jgi:hypothetical protein
MPVTRSLRSRTDSGSVTGRGGWGKSQRHWNELKLAAMVALARWMDSWVGLGAIVARMNAQGFDVQLTAYAGENWRATFLIAGVSIDAQLVAGSKPPRDSTAVSRSASSCVQRNRVCFGHGGWHRSRGH